MTEQYLRIVPAPDETSWISAVAIVTDLTKRIEILNTRIADLEVEVAWYRASFGHVSDQEIQTIISNL